MNQRVSTVKSSELLNEARRESKQAQDATSGAGMRSGRLLAGAVLLSVVVSLSACGQKGDLYLPDEKPEQARP